MRIPRRDARPLNTLRFPHAQRTTCTEKRAKAAPGGLRTGPFPPPGSAPFPTTPCYPCQVNPLGSVGHVKSFPNDCDAELRAWVQNTLPPPPLPPHTGVLPGGREVQSYSILAEFHRARGRAGPSNLPLQAHWPRLVSRLVPQATPSYRPRPAPPLTSSAPPRASPSRKCRRSVCMARESCVSEARSSAAALFGWVRDSAPGLGKRLGARRPGSARRLRG